MRLYESVYIVAATIPEDDLPELTQKVEGIISQEEGLVVKHTPWGKNKLSYNIKTHGYRHDKGHYFHVEFLSSPPTVIELERNFKIDERFLRFITVKLEDSPDIEALKARAEEEKAKEPPAPAPAPEAEPEVEEPAPEVEAEVEEPAPEEEPTPEVEAPEVEAPVEEEPSQEEVSAQEPPAEEAEPAPEEEAEPGKEE